MGESKTEREGKEKEDRNKRVVERQAPAVASCVVWKVKKNWVEGRLQPDRAFRVASAGI